MKDVRKLRRPPTAPAHAPREAEPRQAVDIARRLWTEAVDPAGTLVERYLSSRGLTLPTDAPIRLHPRSPRGADRLPARVVRRRQFHRDGTICMKTLNRRRLPSRG